MLTRRDFLQLAAATAALTAGAGGLSRALAQQRLTQDDLLRFEPLGQVTLLHFTDIHAQLMPVYFREPEVNLGAYSFVTWGQILSVPMFLLGLYLVMRKPKATADKGAR